MADVFDKEKRAAIMSKVKQKDTQPELIVRKFLFANGFRFRKNVTTLPGSPDIVLPKYKTAIFVNGCFWHGHKDCRHSNLPSSNREYWEKKVTRNIARDDTNVAKLESLGWRVIIIWTCEIGKKSQKEAFLNDLLNKLRNDHS
ncbi:DNA mismatch endonuclease Vsr [Chitinophaga sancti]|uniref:very short patch repair endonuclease n=1 Tax=Chitinophaga sancti TaxID=1004 RepID=UPI002A74F97C|nr:DNA mismatch endonuclease Vsr [Chitinophaga sancti]WPQ63420.1 DNA mismatch endonuclease Vsr [Chitinophaga sancti]